MERLKISNRTLIDKERPMIDMPAEILLPMLWTSVRMMQDPEVPTAFKYHAVEMYQDVERELSMRN